MHIGLIGGIGPAATVFYYERLVREFAAREQPLHLTVGHTSARTLSANVAAGRAVEQADEFARIARQLQGAGAEAVAITSMGGHFCAREFVARSPLPSIDGPGAVAGALERRGIRRIGILGTRIVMRTRLYGALAALEPIAPVADAIDAVDADYVAMAVAGTASDGQRQRLLEAGRRLVEHDGAQAILLGGTDLSLVFDGVPFDVPVIDCAALHADAIVDAALAAR